MQEPLRQIVTNAGEEGSVILAKVEDGKDSFGYNAATSEFGDLLKMGILDPTKVSRTALQNASSIAGFFLALVIHSFNWSWGYAKEIGAKENMQSRKTNRILICRKECIILIALR